jgi:hypothetical protein
MLSLLSVAFPMRAVTIAIDASGRGAIAADGGGDFNQFGSYFAGMTTNAFTPPPGPYPGGGDPWRDRFEFAIPVLSAPLLQAWLDLYQPPVPCDGCSGGFSPADSGDTAHLFSVNGLSSYPVGAGGFIDIGNGSPYASVWLDANTDGTTVNIWLGGNALADILSAQGGMFYLGGVDSAETFSASTHSIGDWQGSNSPTGVQDGRVQLILDLGIVPEPASWLMMLGALGLAVPAMRRARHI